MFKLRSSARSAALLSVAMSGVLLLADDTLAGCKWFKVCGYTPGDPSPVVQSADPGCFTVNGISVEVGSNGCVSFQLCNESVPISCAGCSGDVAVSLTQPGSPTRTVLFRCQGCGVPFICCGFATVDDCIGNICTTTDGDTFPTAINVTACAVPPLNEELCAEGFPAFLTATDGAANDLFFGFSVSIDRDVTIVGAWGDNGNGPLSGSAYVLRRIGASWIEEAKLTASDGSAGDAFGASVSINGNVAVVGALRDDDNGSESGSAYVFRRIGTSWIEEAKLTPSDGAAEDFFGVSVTNSGEPGNEAVIVGANQDDDNGKFSGSAYIFRRIGTSWIQAAKLTPSDGVYGDKFGASVSISGDVLVVGSQTFSGLAPGSAYVFVKPPNGWANMTHTAKLISSDAAIGDQFGISVSISGPPGNEVVVVGARLDDDNGSNSGSAYVFVKPPGGWVDMTQTAKLLPDDGMERDRFGNTVTISGDVIGVGAPSLGLPTVVPGKAYVFHKPPGGWMDMTQTTQLTALGGANGDEFGLSMSIDGATAIVGAWLHDNGTGQDAGSAFIFTGAGDPDCNGNGVSDGCDILNGVSLDCNGNGVPDVCEVIGGFSVDCNGNEIPDECEVVFAFTTDSLQLAPIGDGSPQSLTIFDALPAAGDVTLSFVARGDFDAADEFVDVDISGVAAGSVFVSGGGDCTVPYDIDEIVVSAATYNSALKGGTDAVINLVASAQVDPNPVLCNSFIALTVQYQAIPATDTNANGIPDICEPPCPADLNEDGVVGFEDLTILLTSWVAGTTQGDIGGAGGCDVPDGVTDFFDLSCLLAAWAAGGCP